MIPLPQRLRSLLEPLRGKVLRLEVAGLRVGPQFTFAGDCVIPVPFGAADVTIRAGLRDYLALAMRREDADSLFFARRLVIEGDTALGLIVKNALESIG